MKRIKRKRKIRIKKKCEERQLSGHFRKLVVGVREESTWNSREKESFFMTLPRLKMLQESISSPYRVKKKSIYGPLWTTNYFQP